MKKIILFILLPVFGITQNNRLDQKNGFEWYVFGTSPSEYNNLVFEEEEEGVRVYSSQQGFPKFEDIEFDDIIITFDKNKLNSISLKTKSETGTKFLLKLREMYGEPKISSKKDGDYEWLGTKVLLKYEQASPTDAIITFNVNK